MNQHMKHSHASNAYRSAAVATSPLSAVVMLYDAAINGLKRTMASLEEKRFEDAFKNLERATTILRALCHNLDFEKGGAFAERMRDTYVTLIMSALHAYGKPDAAARFQNAHRRLDRPARLLGRGAYATVKGTIHKVLKAREHKSLIPSNIPAL